MRSPPRPPPWPPRSSACRRRSPPSVPVPRPRSWKSSPSHGRSPASAVYSSFSGLELLLGILLDLLLLGLDIVVQICGAPPVESCAALVAPAPAGGSGSRLVASRSGSATLVLEPEELHVPILKNQQLANIVVHLGPARRPRSTATFSQGRIRRPKPLRKTSCQAVHHRQTPPLGRDVAYLVYRIRD